MVLTHALDLDRSFVSCSSAQQHKPDIPTCPDYNVAPDGLREAHTSNRVGCEEKFWFLPLYPPLVLRPVG